MQIDTIEKARREYKNFKRRGIADPARAAKFRRENAKWLLTVAKHWRDRDEMLMAMQVARTARAVAFLALLIEGRMK